MTLSNFDRYQRIAWAYDLLDLPFEYGRDRKGVQLHGGVNEHLQREQYASGNLNSQERMTQW